MEKKEKKRTIIKHSAYATIAICAAALLIQGADIAEHLNNLLSRETSTITSDNWKAVVLLPTIILIMIIALITITVGEESAGPILAYEGKNLLIILGLSILSTLALFVFTLAIPKAPNISINEALLFAVLMAMIVGICLSLISLLYYHSTLSDYRDWEKEKR